MCKQIEYARWWARENIKQDEIGSDRLKWRKVVTLHKMVREPQCKGNESYWYLEQRMLQVQRS